MECPKCQTENREGRRFCAKCGTPLVVTCPECSFANEPDAEFCGGCGKAIATTTAVCTADRARERKVFEAERRQLTVMFCDLVGSTALAERLDPEVLREVLAQYQDACASVIERLDGYIARYVGDGLLVYFGYPQAHEDDTEGAVRAGLSIVEAIRALDAKIATLGVKLAVRIGIATGLVVAGDIGSGERVEEKAIVGETPNIAARLQALAEPNTVLIGASTQRLVEGLFDCVDLGAQKLKGISRAVTAYQVRGESGVPSRFEAAAIRGLTPLVGRESEIGLLLNRWEQAKEGESQVAQLSGEAGIGKSRIVQGFRERLEGEPHNRVLYYGSPYRHNSALHPAIDQLERGLRFAKDDTQTQKLDKLETMLANLGLPTAEYAPVLASLLSLAVDDRYLALELSPQKRKKKTLEAIVMIVQAMSSRQPVLMVVEDAQWIDPSTLELISLLIEQLSSARLLLLITCRLEFDAPWSGRIDVTALTLNRLSRKESAGMVAVITQGKSLPAEVLDQIVAKTDGVPLFVEELTKNVLEAGLLKDAGDHYALSGPLPELAIPASLHDSLTARLDRLARVKDVAQLGATVGRTFSHELLAAVSSLAEQELQNALAQLLQAELIYRRGLPPDVTYEFKHGLVQDVAYQSLLKSTRQQYHQQIARVLEEKFPQTVETAPEILAHHYAEASRAEKAIHYWHRAGQLAMARSASKEAHAHFTHGLELLGTLPNTTERKIQEIALQNALAVAVINVAGLASADLERAYLRARDLCEQIGDHKQQFVVEWGLWHVHIGRGDFHRGRRLADQLLEKAQHHKDPDVLLEAYHADWSVLSLTGHAEAARERCDQGWGLYDREAHGAHAFIFGGHDPGVCSRNMGSWAMWRLGYADQARACYQQGLTLAKDLGHPQIIAHAYNWGAALHQFCRDRTKVQELAEVALELATEQALANYYTDATILNGWLLTEDGQPKDAIRLMTKALAEREARGTMFLQPYYIGLLVQAYVRAGDIAEALRLLTDAIERAQNTGEGWIEADLHRMKGDLLLSSGKQYEAEACLRETLQIAGVQNAKAYELRATISLARLFAEQSKHAQAHELLAPVYDWFTEGFDTADLREAKVLLDELA